MKKIILTEQQAQNLINKIVNEQVPAVRATEYTMDDGRYRMKCRFDFQYNDEFHRYKNGEIDNIEYGSGEVSFLIDIQHETYGIKDIIVTDIKGPDAIKTKIRFYPEGSSSEDEDWYNKRQEEEITIPLNWKKLEVDDDGYKMDYYGLYKVIDVNIMPDGNGGLIGGKMEATTKIFRGESD